MPATATPLTFCATRLPGNPIVHAQMSTPPETNLNGPSLIRVPDWIIAPLGKYYLYFAHHHGHHIRMAYANDLAGPWMLHAGGTLQLRETPGARWNYGAHIASPDVHVDEASRRIVMFYHAGYRLLRPRQATYVAESQDGIAFASAMPRLGEPYWRRFCWKGRYYAITMSGQLYASDHPTSAYRPGPRLSLPGMRHSAVWCSGERLHLFFSRIGDAPERILVCSVDLREDWNTWTPSPSETVLFPKEPYEGVDRPVAASRPGAVYERVRELRDPFVFDDGGELYLLYAAGGESAIGIARLQMRTG